MKKTTLRLFLIVMCALLGVNTSYGVPLTQELTFDVWKNNGTTAISSYDKTDPKEYTIGGQTWTFFYCMTKQGTTDLQMYTNKSGTGGYVISPVFTSSGGMMVTLNWSSGTNSMDVTTIVNGTEKSTVTLTPSTPSVTITEPECAVKIKNATSSAGYLRSVVFTPVFSGPEIKLSSQSLAFATAYQTMSSEQSIDVNASKLTSDINLVVEGADADQFELQNAAGNVITSLVQNAGEVNETIKVVYKRTKAGTHSAKLKLSATDATDVYVDLTGESTVPVSLMSVTEFTLPFTLATAGFQPIGVTVKCEVLPANLTLAVAASDNAAGEFQLGANEIAKETALAASGCEIPLTFKATAAGVYNTTVTLSVSYDGNTVTLLEIPVKVTVSDQISQVSEVLFSVDGGVYNAVQTVALSCAMPATIYYTLDASDPFTSNTALVYSNAITVDKTMTIKAGAKIDGLDNSIITEEIYLLQVPAVVSSLAMSPAVKFDAVQTTTLSVEGFPHAKIYFDATDKTPSITDTFLYDGTPIVIDGTTAIKAIATIDGWENSDVVRFSWTATDFKLPVPTADVPEGTYNTPQSVTLSSSVAGATVKYVIGSTWNDASAVEFTTPIEINTTTTIIAKAEKNGWTGSNQFKATYTIDNSIMKWTPTGSSPQQVVPSLSVLTGLVGANLKITNFSDGASNVIGGTPATKWCMDILSFDAAVHPYYSFSVAASDGYILSLTNLQVNLKMNKSASSIKRFAIQCSVGDESNYQEVYISSTDEVTATSKSFFVPLSNLKTAKTLYFRIIPLSTVATGGAFYLTNENGGLVLEGTVVPMETSTVTDATTIEQDVDGHLVVDGSNGTLPQISVPVEKQVAGKVTVARKFENKKNWYAVSFPFDIESVAVVHTDGTDFPLIAGTHYWLRSFEPKNITESIIFGDVASIQANKGYIIAFPQSFPDGGFTVKFTSVAGVTLNADDTAPKSTATGGMYEFVGNAVLKDYAVSGESYKLSADGTNFVKTSGAVYSPYEGLVFIPSASAAKAPLYLPVDQKPSGLDGLAADEMTVTCANGKIMVTSAEDTRVTVYHVSGTLVSQIDVAAGTTYTIDVPAGIYVVNKQKVVVY
ncbi:MAG: chitobiase/beta-hexosaminidase C-terminal domain-containing protein [Barnesiella sp.]